MRLRTAATLLGVAALIGGGVFGIASAQAAPNPRHQPAAAHCRVVGHGDAQDILTTSNGEPVTPTNPVSSAQVKVLANGVEATLPDNTAKAQFLVQPASTTTVASLNRLTYRTYQLNASSVAVWSYNIAIDINGGTLGAGEFTTLVYEPYQDQRTIKPNEWQTWDTLRGGAAKWWSTRSLALVPNGATQSFPTAWSMITSAYPNATVLAWGTNLGKGAPGASARVNAVTFGTARTCTTHEWSTRYARSPRHNPFSLFPWLRRFLP
jgi:hypothetical protein